MLKIWVDLSRLVQNTNLCGEVTTGLEERIAVLAFATLLNRHSEPHRKATASPQRYSLTGSLEQEAW